MIDLSKPSWLDLYVATAIGSVIGSVTAMKAEEKRQKMTYESEKRRQDNLIKTYREAHNESELLRL